jgi:hypothetical protein
LGDINALVDAIMNGSFKPPPQVNGPGYYYASDQTAQQLASLLGGAVVQQVPFGTTNAATEQKANFIQLPSGQTVNAADLASYAKDANVGAAQLTADLTSEITAGANINNENQQTVAWLAGGPLPTYTADSRVNVPFSVAPVAGQPVASAPAVSTSTPAGLMPGESQPSSVSASASPVTTVSTLTPASSACSFALFGETSCIGPFGSTTALVLAALVAAMLFFGGKK